MDTVKVVQLIETTLTRRGDGITDPIRVVKQFWTFDGELVAEVDPTKISVVDKKVCFVSPVTDNSQEDAFYDKVERKAKDNL